MYKQGIVENLTNLLNIIEIEAKNNDYQVLKIDSNTIVVFNNRFALHIQAMYLNLTDPNDRNHYNGPKINFTLLDNYDPSIRELGRQRGFLRYLEACWFYPPFVRYHLFSTANYMYFVVETSAGVFAHFGWGELDDCIFFYGQGNNRGYTSYHEREPYYPFNGNNAGLILTNNKVKEKSLREFDVYYNSYGQLAMRNVLVYSPSKSTGVTPLLPFFLFTESDDKQSHDFHGQVPDMRALNITHFLPAESYMLGDDEWVIFPVKAKRFPADPIPSTKLHSDLFGIAYKKNP